jgi:hypothetical protein
MVPFITDLKAKFKTVKYIRCDDAGENKALEKACLTTGLGIQFEYTAPGTPQQNGRVKQKFTTLYGRVRSMLNHAGLSQALRHGIWAEAAATATLISNAVITRDKPTAPYVRFYNKEPTYIRNLKQFGEIGVVRNHALKLKGKLTDRGRHCLFLGYGSNHADNCFPMMNLETCKVIHTRDVIWLTKSYGKFKKSKPPITLDDSDDEEDNGTGRELDSARIDDDDGLIIHINPDDPPAPSDNDDEDNEPKGPPLNHRQAHEMKKLGGWFNPAATAMT